ncbi:MAG: uroporphyrinogen-III C-methyltransferase [Acidimicrobiales bacterium]|jgi:uroporphyrin-III C-methyltransferase
MTVYLVGAGPGSVDLVTLRAATLLANADVVVFDRLIDPEVLDLAGPGAELIDVGKRPGHSNSQDLINALLVSLGEAHQHVVRLKGGDPFVFGRGGEEFEALQRAGIDCEVVPGVSSAFAGPLIAGIPVTHRGLSHGVTIVTGHAREGAAVDFRRLANPDVTLVVLMGVQRRATIMSELLEGGLDASTPIAAIERASMRGQRVRRGELAQLATMEIESPAVLVIGPVAHLEFAQVTALVDAATLASS